MFRASSSLAACALAISAALAALFPASASGQAIVINEIFRWDDFGPGGREWMEVVLREDLTAAELETYYVGDSQITQTGKASSLRFQNMAAIAPMFQAGTIILIGGEAAVAQDVSYSFPSDRLVALESTGSHFAARGVISFDTLDVVWVDQEDDPDATIGANGFAVAWNATVGPFASEASVVAPVGPPNGGPGSLSLDMDVASAGSGSGWTVGAASPGAGNGGANSVSIATLPVELSGFALE